MKMKLHYLSIATALRWQSASARSLLHYTLDCATTCSPELCSCISTSNSPASCAQELHQACTSDTKDDCIPSSATDQFRSLHCPYAACLVSGKSDEECACDIHGRACEMYEGENMGYCETADCCESAADENGMKDCLQGEKVLGIRATPTLSPVKVDSGSSFGLTESAFEFDDTILFHEDDHMDFIVDDNIMNDDNKVLTWIEADVLPELTSHSSSSIEPVFELPLDYARFCSSNCDPTLCTCLTIKKDYSACVSELYFSCRDDTIQQCVPDVYVSEFTDVYCPYSECIVLGNVEGVGVQKCNRDMYVKLCELSGDELYCELAKSEEPTYDSSVTPTMSPSNDPIVDAVTTLAPSTTPSQPPLILLATSPVDGAQTPADASQSPSNSPSVPDEPSMDPTATLSLPPSASPDSDETSMDPTATLSLPPTASPVTDEPSMDPTATPSLHPSTPPVTDEPSMDPTFTPSLHPSESAVTDEPSMDPTATPSLPPSVSPVTDEPSKDPTATLSLHPSVSPVTDEPSMDPTATPSLHPNASPVTDEPSRSPSLSPTTSAPSKAPVTDEPSTNPSSSPSQSLKASPDNSKPTKRPPPKPATAMPSESPTAEPSFSPTVTPSWTPTTQPTLELSQSPVTSKPTKQPSQSPVTNMPTYNPTKTPTSKPFIAPVTSDPIVSPSTSPIKTPTLSPSTPKPSENSTPVPSSSPSKSPVADSPIEQNINCPETYDQLWTSSYNAGTQVEVSGYIYKCNPYPYSIYCKFSDYQPVYGSELWSDAWTEVGPCQHPDHPTIDPTESSNTEKPTKLPTSLPTSLSPSSNPTTSKLTDTPSKMPSTQNPSRNPPSPQTSDPTASLSDSPSAGLTESSRIEIATLVQFQMQTMTKLMNQYEQIGVFEPSCGDFLTTQLVNEDPLIYNIKCTVTNQQLLSDNLQELSSLLVDVEALGEVIKTDTVISSDDVPFGDMVYDAFAENNEIFINSLKNKGDIAGIDTFDELSSVTSVTRSNNKDLITDGGGSKNQSVRTGALAALVIGGVAFILLIIAFVFQVRIHFADDDSLDDDDGESDKIGLNLPPENIDCPNVISEDSAQRNDSNLSYAYSLDDGINSPISTVSASKPTWDEGSPMRVQREVIAPAGKLGIIIDTSSQGPIVHSVKSESVLEGLVFVGDLIIALDDEDTSNWSAHNLTKLVASRSKCERKITLLSSVAV